jgi:hypothetical protein
MRSNADAEGRQSAERLESLPTRFLTRMMSVWRHSGCGYWLAKCRGLLPASGCSSLDTSSSVSLQLTGRPDSSKLASIRAASHDDELVTCRQDRLPDHYSAYED